MSRHVIKASDDRYYTETDADPAAPWTPRQCKAFPFTSPGAAEKRLIALERDMTGPGELHVVGIVSRKSAITRLREIRGIARANINPFAFANTPWGVVLAEVNAALADLGAKGGA